MSVLTGVDVERTKYRKQKLSKFAHRFEWEEREREWGIVGEKGRESGEEWGRKGERVGDSGG